MQDTQCNTAATILLACHNGGQWLALQLESLLAQDHSNLHILVRDDASLDDTPALLEQIQRRAPGRITLLPNASAQPLGARLNFVALLEHALEHRQDEFFLCCDQDDLWAPDKVSTLLASLENCDRSRPALAFSDMRVVNAAGDLVAPSFLDHQWLSTRPSLSRLLVQNHVSGCAALFNRATLALATPVPEEVLMHDWWLALLAAAAGELRYCERPLLDYRQHEANVIGASGFSARYLWRRATRERGVQLTALYEQAATLATRLGERGYAEPDALTSFLQTRRLSRLRRARALMKAGFTRRGLVRNLPLWLGEV